MPTYTATSATTASSTFTYMPVGQFEYVDTYADRMDRLENEIYKLATKLNAVIEAVDEACLNRSWEELEQFLLAYKRNDST